MCNYNIAVLTNTFYEKDRAYFHMLKIENVQGSPAGVKINCVSEIDSIEG